MAVTGEIEKLNNLYTDMQTKMDKEFETESYTEGMTCNDWSWGDNETITIPTTSHFSLVEYDVTQPWYQRTGTAQQVYDEINRYTVRRKYTFHGEIDEVPSMDQRFIRKMATACKETVDEELVPMNDKYRLNTWANGAGVVMFGGAAATKNKRDASTDEDIIRTLLTINSKANNLHVPQDGRTYIMSETQAIETRLADRLQYNQEYTGRVLKGQIGNINGKPIVAVPDDYMPDGVKIMMKWHKASADPRKCHKLRTLSNVVGSFATHAEGLFRYDSFVRAHKANGIILFCEGTTSSANAKVCDRPVIKYAAKTGESATGNELTIAAPSSVVGVTSSVTYYYVITQAPIFPNPKVKKDAGEATAYSSALTGFTAGNTYYVSAYAHKDGCVDSQIARLKFTASDTALSSPVTSDD